MGNILIPGNSPIFQIGKLDTINYKFNNLEYQTNTWSAKTRLLYKFENSEKFDLKNLSSKEEEEFSKLFDGLSIVPNEIILKRTLLVIICKRKQLEFAIGLNPLFGIEFKSVKVCEIRKIYKKYYITLNYDSKFAWYLLKNVYINDMIPEELLEYAKHKYLKIARKNNVFKNKILKFFEPCLIKK